jgi:hypothetical protein
LDRFLAQRRKAFQVVGGLHLARRDAVLREEVAVVRDAGCRMFDDIPQSSLLQRLQALA